jgi:hypothetical protein
MMVKRLELVDGWKMVFVEFGRFKLKVKLHIWV